MGRFARAPTLEAFTRCTIAGPRCVAEYDVGNARVNWRVCRGSADEIEALCVEAEAGAKLAPDGETSNDRVGANA